MIEDFKATRGYIENLRTDPRTRAMFDGWVAQATKTAEARIAGRFGHDAHRLAHEAATEALTLALSFILDNDGELQAVRHERDTLLKQLIDLHASVPRIIKVPKTPG
jgi:hypothetical protein